MQIKVKLLTFFFLSSVLMSEAQIKYFDPHRKYPADSLRVLNSDIMNELKDKHPGFYRYTDKERFDYLIDSTKQSIQEPLTEMDYYRKLKPLFAQIGCLHTEITLSENYREHLDKSFTLIPIEIFLDTKNNKVLISKNYSAEENIPVGGELLSVNGEPITAVMQKLRNAITSDGYNITAKNLLINYRFPFWYQSVIDTSGTYEIVVKSNGNEQIFKLKGVSKDAFPSLKSLEKNYKKPLAYEIVNTTTALLTIHSFSNTAIKEENQNFRKFVHEVFETAKAQNLENLIIDVRNNTGGTDKNAALLTRYFFDKPFRYWEKIEVTEPLAKEIKGTNRLFYKKPKEFNGSYLWQKTWLTREFDYYEEQHPAKNNFSGNTYILTNGLCMSSCADFTAILSHNQKATIIGEETGGGYQGNTSGMMNSTTIPTGLIITVPLQKYTNAVDLTKYFGRGTQPDHEITPAFDDWISKRDVEMKYVIELIENKGKVNSKP